MPPPFLKPQHKTIMKNQDELVAQLSKIMDSGDRVLATETAEGQQKSMVSEQKFHDFRISALSFLSRVFGEDSTYYQSFKSEVTQPTASRTRRGIGMLTAAREELQGDWLETTSGAINRDTLTDLLRIARLQQEENHPAAAVIITGAALEKHLRSLCLAKGLKIHNEQEGKAVAKRGLQLTGEAYRRKLYDRQENKEVVAWLELFEQTAAGRQEGLTAAKAKQMVNGVLSFIAKTRY
jgi:hypothetical protein